MQQRKRGNGKRKPRRKRRYNKQGQEWLTSVQPAKDKYLTAQAVKLPCLYLHSVFDVSLATKEGRDIPHI